MQIDELATLEYPRHVHKPAGAYLRVENSVECADALDAGWSLVPVLDAPIADATEEPVADADPVADPTPAKHKRRGKA